MKGTIGIVGVVALLSAAQAAAAGQELRLPRSGLTVHLPAGASAWEPDPFPRSDLIDWIRRVRPGSPLLTVQVGTRRDVSATQCARYLEGNVQRQPGASYMYRPAFLPSAGWHGTVVRMTSDVGLICGPARGHIILVTFGYVGDFNSSDLADLKVLLERIGEAVGMTSASYTTPSYSSSSSTASKAPAPSSSSSSAASASDASPTRPSTPAPAPAPTSTYSPSDYSSYEDDSSFFDFSDAELGGIEYLWYVAALRSGLDEGEPRYGGLLGTSGFLFDDDDDFGTAFHYDLALGYAPRDGLAFEATTTIGFGPVWRDDFGIAALAGLGMSRWDETRMPLNVLGILELRARLKGEVLGFEGAFGRYYSSAETSNRIELRLFFALAEESTWMVGWRHGMYPSFAQDLIFLGHEW